MRVNRMRFLESVSPQQLCSRAREVLGPWSSSVRMAKLQLMGLKLLGLGSIWVCSWQAAQEASVGCAINCADFSVKYQTGVRPFWLNIAYHQTLGKVAWQDRVLGAMRLVLRNVLDGEDVVIHCDHGPQMEKVVCESKCLNQF